MGGTYARFDNLAVELTTTAALLAFAVAWILRLPAEHDSVDRLVLGAVIVFLAACLFSSSPRQSFDSAVQVMGIAGLFYLLRGISATERARRRLLYAMKLCAVALALLLAATWILAWVIWEMSAASPTIPPLGLPVSFGLFGHRHDVTVLAVLLLPALWVRVDGKRNLSIAVVTSFLVAFVVVADASRNVWLAATLATATLVVIVMRFRPGGSRHVTCSVGAAVVGIIAIVLAATPAGGALAGSVASRLLDIYTLGARGAQWDAATQIWSANILTGCWPGDIPMGVAGYFIFRVDQLRTSTSGQRACPVAR